LDSAADVLVPLDAAAELLVALELLELELELEPQPVATSATPTRTAIHHGLLLTALTADILSSIRMGARRADGPLV
jgi:hypothetical protein